MAQGPDGGLSVSGLIFVGGLAVTIIETVLWFETGRLPKIWDDLLWMNLPLDLTALMTGAVIRVTGALVVNHLGAW
jgi:hypothetical protein